MAAATTCLNGQHAFTPLRQGWEPDAATPCDCGVVSWAEHVRAGLRAKVEASLAAEARKRRTPPAPGPDPEICNAVHPTQGICGGPMSPPHKGPRTGIWIRTCRDCLSTTGTTEPPAWVLRRTAFELPVPGPMFTPIETIARPTRHEFDARQRQSGERE